MGKKKNKKKKNYPNSKQFLRISKKKILFNFYFYYYFFFLNSLFLSLQECNLSLRFYSILKHHTSSFWLSLLNWLTCPNLCHWIIWLIFLSLTSLNLCPSLLWLFFFSIFYCLFWALFPPSFFGKKIMLILLSCLRERGSQIFILK